jgi:hypothetical protein
MPDFAMCQDSNCPSAKLCLRSPLSGTKENRRWQARLLSYRGFGAPRCDYFLEKDYENA